MGLDRDIVNILDKGSFELLFNKYYGVLCVLAQRYLKDSYAAEEVVCEVFYNLWDKRLSINIESSLKNYLIRSTHNHCLNIIRHNKVKALHSQEVLHVSSDLDENTPHNYIETTDIKRISSAAIDSLPSQCRQIFIMSREENLSNKEIAEKLNISINTVKTQLSRGSNRLRDALKDYLYTLL